MLFPRQQMADAGRPGPVRFVFFLFATVDGGGGGRAERSSPSQLASLERESSERRLCLKAQAESKENFKAIMSGRKSSSQ